jgi:hypothetical protein
VKHFASARFWRCYRTLPIEIRALADRNYALLKANPSHRSLHFKQVGVVWSVRVGLHYRALATAAGDDLVWFWVGSHAEYDRLVGRKPADKALQPTKRAAPKAKSTRRARQARG